MSAPPGAGNPTGQHETNDGDQSTYVPSTLLPAFNSTPRQLEPTDPSRISLSVSSVGGAEAEAGAREGDDVEIQAHAQGSAAWLEAEAKWQQQLKQAAVTAAAQGKKQLEAGEQGRVPKEGEIKERYDVSPTAKVRISRGKEKGGRWSVGSQGEKIGSYFERALLGSDDDRDLDEDDEEEEVEQRSHSDRRTNLNDTFEGESFEEQASDGWAEAGQRGAPGLEDSKEGWGQPPQVPIGKGAQAALQLFQEAEPKLVILEIRQQLGMYTSYMRTDMGRTELLTACRQHAGGRSTSSSGLQFRDIRFIQAKSEPAIFVRRGAILVALEPINAIVTAEATYVMVPFGSDDFLEPLKKRLASLY